MSGSEKDDIPMLSNLQLSDECTNSRPQPFKSRNRSVSMSISTGGSSDGSNFVASHFFGFTGPLRSERKTPMVQMSGPLNVGLRTDSLFHRNQNATMLKIYDPEKERNYSSFKEKDQDDSSDDDYAGANEHLYRSGPLGICNDPYCTTCPTYSKFDDKQHRSRKAFGGFDSKLQNILYRDARGWSGRFFSLLQAYVPGVMNPHAKPVKRWNQFFVISCLVSIFVDPFFFFLIYVHKENKCISINWRMTTIIVVFRSVTDFIYLLNMFLQFRLAYVNPESTVVGVGDLIDHPKKIAHHYLTGYFLLDLFIVFPIPQILILLVVPKHLGSSGANYAKNLLRAAILAQYIPRLFRFLPLLVGRSDTGFTFESAWANFIINLLTYALSGHVVGSCWYLLGLQRVNQCLRDVCRDSPINSTCKDFIDCGHGDSSGWCSSQTACKDWQENIATKCFEKDGFPYGIYQQAVSLTTEHSIIRRYIYSSFWGFQQISTLAGNQVPSYFVWEVVFTMAIIGLGLLLFALLIGNMQNFLQALGQRKVEMSLRRRDVEQWMRHRRLPEQLRRRIRQAERYNWAATRGVNEETLMSNLPEDLQRDVRRHLFKFVQQIRIFSFMDEPILDSICERLRQKTYIKGSKILDQNGIVEKMVFIVRGKMESVGEDGSKIPLQEGDACGEELITWCLENFSVNQGINRDAKKLRILGNRLSSTRTVTCLTNVEAFTLRSTDIEEVTARFSRFLRNPRVQGAIRYFSTYWRDLAARRIQVAWKRRIKRSSSCRCQLCQQE